MELADVPDSKSGGSDTVWVQIPPSAPLTLTRCCVGVLLQQYKNDIMKIKDYIKDNSYGIHTKRNVA